MNCKFCESDNLKVITSFGRYPVCHKFTKKKKIVKKFELELGICKKCKLSQLTKPFPLKELKPIYNWIKYNEPEEHLDKLVKKIIGLKNINKNSIISGVSYKEISTIKRFIKKGFKKNWILNPIKDLGIKGKKYNLETIQKKISLLKINKVQKRVRKSDVLIVRHILEHSYNIKKFILNLKKLINKNGYIVFEVPDCEESFKKRDYVSLWEEHIFYFTKKTLLNLLIKSGFKIVYFERYNYSYENVLIAIVSLDNFNSNVRNTKYDFSKIKFNYKNLISDRSIIHKKIQNFKKNNYKICLFGTGHSALTFINILKMHDKIDLIIDDDKNKENMQFPGSLLKIKNSNYLKKFDKIIIILGVNFESEKKIIKKVSKLNSYIKYYSVYKNSSYNFFKK